MRNVSKGNVMMICCDEEEKYEELVGFLLDEECNKFERLLLLLCKVSWLL